MIRDPARRRLVYAISSLALAAAFRAHAADTPAPPAAAGPSAGAEGAFVETVIVTAEPNRAAKDAPSKGSLAESQPESIISQKFIELATPETGDFTTVVEIAPSVSGITSNGGGVGEYNKVSIRGFPDGQFNITYDGIAYGDTNDPTHHTASFFPASTIGAAVIDRGPGAAGDLGQANLGGAIHFFSPVVADTFGASQKATYGTFNTYNFVTAVQTGRIASLGDAKALFDFSERGSDGELSYAGGEAQNQLMKIAIPIGSRATLTIYADHNYTKFFLPDSEGPGATAKQVKLYGKNFSLTDDPKSPLYYKFNYESKQTDFEYIDLKGEIAQGFTGENQLYTDFYSNKTIAATDTTALIGGPNTSPPQNKALPATDIGGYDKLNEYRVFGDIVRLNKDLGFGTLKVGGLYELSITNRHNLNIDLTQNRIADNSFKTAPFNANLQEHSQWHQYQLFADFDWRPLENLTVSPGFKYVNFTREIDAQAEKSVYTAAGRIKHFTVTGSETFDEPLYFLTANYRILHDWAIYGQYATGFLIPALSFLQVSPLSANKLQPQQSINYQFGTVYTHGDVTLDADVFDIEINHLQQLIGNQFYGDVGKARDTGGEVEGAYAFPYGFSVFANASVLTAKIIAPTPGSQPNIPRFTDAFGVLYHGGAWEGDVTFKQSGSFYASDGQHLSGYNVTNATVAYDFGLYRVKLSALNLGDNRATTGISGGFYTFQAGREVQLTLQAKF